MGLSPEATIAVFIIGLIPFGVATVEFLRRLSLQKSFGTGKDRVVFIGEPEGEKVVLGNGALVTAGLLFAVAFSVLGLALASVVTSTPPMDLPSVAAESVVGTISY